MEDFKAKSFKALFNERKGNSVTLRGGFNESKVEAPSQEQNTKSDAKECKHEEAEKAVTKKRSCKATAEGKKTALAKKKTAAATKDNVVKEEAAVAENGVYIQDINGKLWKVDDWDDSVQPNAIAVLTPEHRFRIALTEASETMEINGDKHLFSYDDRKVRYSVKLFNDYKGASNTQQIISYQPSAGYAAGWCASYIFPDGETKGYLPALGELFIADKNSAVINAALLKCGGDALSVDEYASYWSSTFANPNKYGLLCGVIFCWNGTARCAYFDGENNVRAFAPLEL